MRLTSLSLFISSPSFSLWLQDTCHLMPFTKYSLLDQSYFFTSCLSIAHIKFTNKIHQLFTDYLLRLPYSELLETHLFRSRANRRLVSPVIPSQVARAESAEGRQLLAPQVQPCFQDGFNCNVCNWIQCLSDSSKFVFLDLLLCIWTGCFL